MSDSKSISGCPDAATLRALLDGTLPEQLQAATQTHADQCPICEAALRQMTAGGESWIGLAEKLKGESSDDPKLAAAMERLKSDDGSTSDASEAADPQRTLDFLQPSDDPKSLGRLGQHEVLEVVGWGGMGVVLKAYDPSLHRVVAVKVLASHLAHHAVARKRFIREAQAAAAVCHDNVVTIHGIDESGPQPKIVMQFVAGGSLQERIDQEGPLELKEILRIAMQTAAGLAAAHAQGVVHRDVKPANILLENGVQRVKLTDFGLARVMDDASLTLSGVIAGTPQYMAPEQAWGRDVDARADLFSLGAVMYAMCSGHSPFRARTTMAVLKRVCEDAPRPLRAINPDVPAWLVAIIEKLLAKKPEDRFQSATEVSELLARWLAHVQQPGVVPAPEFIARRGSPAPAASPDRRSPDFSDGLSAGPGSPRTAGAPRWPLSAKFVAWPMVVMGALLGFSLMMVLESGSQNLVGYLFGFCLIQLAATFALSATFRAAWNTSSWALWIGAILFLPAAASAFGLIASYRDSALAFQFFGALQALTALAYWFGLLFVRPFLVPGTGRWMTERLTGWERLIAIACFTIFGTPLVLLFLYRFSHVPTYEPPVPAINSKAATIFVPTDNDPSGRGQRSDEFPKPSLLSMPGGVGVAAETPSNAIVPEKLKGRWVVVSTEGASLGSFPGPTEAAGSPSGATAPGMAAGGGPMAMAGGAGMFGGMGANSASPPLQWIEFAENRVVVFDGRETTLIADGSELTEPKRLFLGTRDEQTSAFSFWRSGIYRLERDRLIICWTSHGAPLPTEFGGDTNPPTELLVLRREWNPPADFDPSKTPPPRAVIPFTADEAKRYQEAWARSANVSVEITDSLGMKLRLIPPGAFDSLQQQMLASVYLSPYREVGVVFDPPVPSRPLYLATHEVTLGQFRKFVEATQYVTSAERLSQPMTWKSPGITQDGEEHPVVRVSWTDAAAFCQWLRETEHESYRLPQFAEWAFAARAGLAADLRIKPPVNSRLKFFDTTAPVGGDTANVFGLHDLFGNVSEWTFDMSVQPGETPLDNGLAKPEDKRRVFNLGGGFRSAMSDWQTANGGRPIQHAKAWLFPREADDPSAFDDVGFRVAREIAKQGKPSDKLDEPSAQ